jgi:hypothetical protein
MDPELAKLLTEVIEKAGLLRRDMQQHGDLEKYEARFARIDQTERGPQEKALTAP